ncbi:SMP-30/gluconolactonase/LRE family protein [Streptomyces sp. CA-111067]|uniref:SMP-30/gluconolactonase/LRE family protein n=1 Tax=Streptomyces sp. CA-111067 TaxID=3240046 RepID=UPI003D951116
MSRAEQLTEAAAAHGEGPVWWPDWGGLRWVDMLAGDILHLDASGRVHRRHIGAVAAALRPRSAGGMVVATEHGFVLTDPEGEPVATTAVLTDPAVRFNDGGCDPDGNFYCGTMAYAETPRAGALYRLRPDGGTETVLRDVTISNGLAWSPDGTTAYYVDSPTRRIDVFDYDTLTGLHDRRPFAEVTGTAGAPDGLTVDAEGGVWVALWDGAAVRRYGPGGTLDEVIDLPVGKVTSCAFGGPDLADLFMTTSRHGETCPPSAAGAVFHTRPGVRGLLPLPYAG